MYFVIWVIWLKIYSDDNARLIDTRIGNTALFSVVFILAVVMRQHPGPVHSAGKLVIGAFPV